MRSILTFSVVALSATAFNASVSAQSASAPVATPASALVASTTDASLYKAFGEKVGLTVLMQDFVARLVVDSRMAPFFKNSNKENLAAQLTDQLCMVSGGPCRYRGASMKVVHAEMDISKADFNALVEVLQHSMDAKGIPFSVQNRMLAKLAPMHRDMVNR
jgi:hemoglobin